MQAIPFELNLRKERWMFVCIYRPPKQDSQYFLENLSLIIDHYSSIYDNHIILGDFNMEPKNPKLASFMNSFNLYNLQIFKWTKKVNLTIVPKNTKTLKKHLKMS